MSHFVKPPIRRTSKSSAQVGDSTSSRALVNLGRQTSNNLQQADISRTKSRVGGNTADALVEVTFPLAGRDVFVSHGFGYRVDNFNPESPSGPGSITLGSKPPNIFGIWLKSDTAGLTARIRMKGQTFMANFLSDLNLIRDGVNFIAEPVRRALEAIQAKFPIRKADISSVSGAAIDWSGSPVLPADIIPFDQAPAASAGFQFISCLDVYRDGVCQYRDDDSLFFGPGHLLHRGLFKRQACNDDSTWVSAIAASLTIPDECPVSEGTTTGLAADAWYYVYWKLDAAGEGPEYRISKVPPIRCPGYGPEHPVYEKLRFVGTFRTIANGAIRPFHRYCNGRVFWREIIVGPTDPTYDIDPNSGGVFVGVDVSAHVPPTADAVFVTAEVDSENKMWVRVTGDVTDPSGFKVESDEGDEDHAWMEVPVHVMDGFTGQPATDTKIDINDGSASTNKAAIAGYFEALL